MNLNFYHEFWIILRFFKRKRKNRTQWSSWAWRRNRASSWPRPWPFLRLSCSRVAIYVDNKIKTSIIPKYATKNRIHNDFLKYSNGMILILLKQKKCWYLDDAGLDLWSGTSLIQRVLLNLVKPVLFKKKIQRNSFNHWTKFGLKQNYVWK